MSEIRITAETVNSEGNRRRLGREEVTIGSVTILVEFHRTDVPPLFAGFQQDWISGSDPDSGATFELCCGAGWGSKYMTLRAELNGKVVYEYVDVAELLTARLRGIVGELTGETTPSE